MEFFQKLNAALLTGQKATLTVLRGGGAHLTIGFLPELKLDADGQKLMMLELTGTPEELDNEFFDHVKRQKEAATGIKTNIESVEKAARELAEAKTKEAARQKTGDKIKATAKPAKKAAAKPEKKKAEKPAKKQLTKAEEPAKQPENTAEAENKTVEAAPQPETVQTEHKPQQQATLAL
jgi:PRTRC genetic system protein E